MTELRVSNPLAEIPIETLEKDVEDFAAANGLGHITPLLQKGALVARDPAAYEELNLDESEREALRTEVLHRWRHPILLYVTIIICSVGAAVQYVIIILSGTLLLTCLPEDGIRQARMVRIYHFRKNSELVPVRMKTIRIMIEIIGLLGLSTLRPTLDPHSCEYFLLRIQRVNWRLEDGLILTLIMTP